MLVAAIKKLNQSFCVRVNAGAVAELFKYRVAWNLHGQMRVDVNPIQRTHAANPKHLFHGIFDYKNQQSPFCFADFQRLNLLGESRFCHSTDKNPRTLFRLKKSRFYRIILQKRFGNFAT